MLTLERGTSLLCRIVMWGDNSLPHVQKVPKVDGRVVLDHLDRDSSWLENSSHVSYVSFLPLLKLRLITAASRKARYSPFLILSFCTNDCCTI